MAKILFWKLKFKVHFQVKERFPQGVFIFLLPPSLEELKSRITNRGTESEETIRDRMNVAVEELKLLEQL